MRGWSVDAMTPIEYFFFLARVGTIIGKIMPFGDCRPQMHWIGYSADWSDAKIWFELICR